MPISRSTLHDALSKVKSGLATKEIIQQSGSFLLLGDAVAAYNDEIYLVHKVEGLSIQGVVHPSLHEFLERVSDDEVELMVEEKQLVVRAGRAKAGFAFSPEITLPVPTLPSDDEWKEIKDQEVIEALTVCSTCCSRDMAFPLLTCVHAGEKVIESSDSFQILRYEYTGHHWPFRGSLLIPMLSVQQLRRYGEVTRVAETEGWVHFATVDGVILSSRVFSGEYPDLNPHLALTGGIEIEFPEAVLNLIQRAEVVAERMPGIDPSRFAIVSFRVGGGVLTVSSKSDYGWFSEDLPYTYQGEGFSFASGAGAVLALLSKSRKAHIAENRIGFAAGPWHHVVALTREDR